jgi:PAS domain S-box-containing protein
MYGSLVSPSFRDLDRAVLRPQSRSRHIVIPPTDGTPDDGGEAPCFARLLGEPLYESDQVLRDLADAVVIADAEGTIVFWNDAAVRLFGWAANEAVGQSLDLIVPERFRARHWDGYRRAMETGMTQYGDRLLEVPAVHRDSRTMSIAFTVTLLVRPGQRRPYAIAAVIRDDTARRAELRQLRDELAHAAAQSQ